MTELPTEIEQILVDLDPADWDALCARVRPPEQHPDPKIRAAAAAHMEVTGSTIRKRIATKKLPAIAMAGDG